MVKAYIFSCKYVCMSAWLSVQQGGRGEGGWEVREREKEGIRRGEGGGGGCGGRGEDTKYMYKYGWLVLQRLALAARANL